MDWTGLYTGLVKRGQVKRGLVKRGLVKRTLVKHGLVKRRLVVLRCSCSAAVYSLSLLNKNNEH